MKKLLLLIAGVFLLLPTTTIGQVVNTKTKAEVIHKFNGLGTSYRIYRTDIKGSILYAVSIDAENRYADDIVICIGSYKYMMKFAQDIIEIIKNRDDDSTHQITDIFKNNFTIISHTKGISKYVTIYQQGINSASFGQAAAKDMIKFLSAHPELEVPNEYKQSDNQNTSSAKAKTPTDSLNKPTGHIEFAGIEIDGSLATFRSKLIEKGYKPTDSHENILQGNFAGYECDIFIYCVEGADLVHMVIASTKPEESWDRLYTKYLSLVELYSKKYGSPSNSVNKFEYPFDGTTDMQMTAVKTDHAHFMTMWNTPNGDIMISILKEGTIAIYYTDKTNNTQYNIQKEQKIIDEI